MRCGFPTGENRVRHEANRRGENPGSREENAVQSAAITYDEGKISVFYRRNETESAENVSDQQTVAGVMLNAQSAGAYQTPRGLEAGKTVQEMLDAYGEYPGPVGTEPQLPVRHGPEKR